jgi:hypothetical protein
LYDLFTQDALRPDRSSSTHFGLPRVSSTVIAPGFSVFSSNYICTYYLTVQALKEVRKIKPKKTLFTGRISLTNLIHVCIVNLMRVSSK